MATKELMIQRATMLLSYIKKYKNEYQGNTPNMAQMVARTQWSPWVVISVLSTLEEWKEIKKVGTNQYIVDGYSFVKK